MGWRDSLRSAAIRAPTVITIGTFDGVHIGHQHIISQVVHHARRLQASAVALTFDPRPSEVLRPDLPSMYLCSIEERCRRLRQAGADSVLVVPFTRELSQVDAKEFVAELAHSLGMLALVGGPDLAVGRGREGTPSVLREAGRHLGFSVEVVDGFERAGCVVRTSAVRGALAEGEVGKAASLLGRDYSIEGTVVRGDGRGRNIGVPTANVATGENLILPENGVYAVRFRVDGDRWNGAANIGVRPTFKGVGRSLEVHLLDYDGDLYGRNCVVEFVQRLRPEQTFPGIDDLVRQIRQDIRRARVILAGS